MADSKDYRLRPMQAEDLARVEHWRRLPQVNAFMFAEPPADSQQHRRWFEQSLQRKDADYRILLYCEQAIGLANAVDIDSRARQCHWGFYLGEADAPKGSGSVMATLMLEHIFTHHPVDRIIGEVFAFNSASLKLHHKFGFSVDATQTRSMEKNGKPETVLTLTLSRQQWQDRQPAP